RAFKSHADQMKEAGKPFKVVIIALARKLLAIAKRHHQGQNNLPTNHLTNTVASQTKSLG
ncbi:hypothetical protein, partial [Sinorhizobium medicae]